jgi:hypothetical protein
MDFDVAHPLGRPNSALTDAPLAVYGTVLKLYPPAVGRYSFLF